MFKAPKGVRDILPAQIKSWQFMETTIRRVLEDFGFEEIRLPIFEDSRLFDRSIGAETDIVAKEMYRFSDRAGRNFSLRPEGTASAVRAYLEHRLYTPTPDCKLYYQGPMFRAERPQAGRYRQFYQIGVEAFGVDSPYLDAEILVMCKIICQRLGLKDWELQINSVGCPQCRPAYRKELQEYLTQSGALCEDCRRRSLSNPMRVFDCKNPTCKESLKQAPLMLDFLGTECRQHFEQVRSLLDEQQVAYSLNPHLVRGLDYYTRTAFELVSGKLGAQNAFAGGGRYDQLVKEMGGPDIPAIGLAIGLDRLVSLLENEPPADKTPQVFLALLGEQAQWKGLSILLKLRQAGIRAEMDYRAGSLKSQLKRANKLGVDYCLILGEEELQKQQITLRCMKDGSQKQVGIETVIEELHF